MKIIFAGTPEFATPALEALVAAGHQLVMVLTQPDRPSGRGMKLRESAVKQQAKQLVLPVMQPETLKDTDVVAKLEALKADVMVVAAYGLILPETVLNLPRYGCLNIHASLLPRWRGAAPIQRAIEAGDDKTGVCIMQMDEGLDTGAVWRASECLIADSDTAADIHDRLAQIGARDIVAVLQQIQHSEPIKQPEAGITYAKKIGKEDAYVRFNASARQVLRQIHAFNPYPGAWTTHQGRTLKLWRAELVDDSVGKAHAGQILVAHKDRLIVAAKDAAVAITEIQAPGGKRLITADFLHGYTLVEGEHLGSAQ